MMTMGLRNAFVAGATALTVSFSLMDANPRLFLFEKLICSDSYLKSYFRHKHVWVVGASSGIGAEIARQLSSFGADLILSSRESEKLRSVGASCATHGAASSAVVPFDITSESTRMETVVDNLQLLLGNNKLDCIILNAGSGQLMPAVETDPKTVEQLFQTNVLGPIKLTTVLLQRGLLDPERCRHVAVTSSIAAKLAVPLSSSYAASKAALNLFFLSLEAENPWLRIDLVCPGSVDTEFHSSHLGLDEGPEKAKPKKAKREMKMNVERAARLYICSICMKGRFERWIADHPTLLGLYINHLFPALFQSIVKRIGPKRIDAWRQGLNLYDPETWKR